MSLPEFEFDYRKFLDKSTILYGETGTGKSFVIVDILYHLKPHCDQIIVICPTDRQNHTYDRGLVPLPCIHYTITPKLLDDIWERQSALGAVYSRANNPDILASLFNKCNSNEAKIIINNINKKLSDYKDEINGDESCTDKSTKITNMEGECNKLILLIYKHHINENRDKLLLCQLTPDEKFSLKYHNLNPRMVLIFDDCTDLLFKYKRHPVIQKLFYQGRWSYITTILACHTDKALDAELKKNAFVSIFTEEPCARAYFERKSTDLDKEGRSRAIDACKSAFTPLARHQKLIFLREEKKFYRFTSTARNNFEFGSPIIREYCAQIQAESGALSPDNKFIRDFN